MARILFITSVLPWPLRRNGGGQRSALLLRALRSVGDVDVMAIGGNELYDVSITPEMMEAEGVAAAFKRTPLPPRPSRFMVGPFAGLHQRMENWRGRYRADAAAAQWLSDRLKTHSYDLVVVRYLGSGMQAGIDQMPELRNVPHLLDFDDIDWQTLEAQLAHEPWPGLKGRIGSAMVLRELKKTCQRALDRFQHVWVTSAEDAELLRGRPVSVLPNIPYVDEGATPQVSTAQTDSHEVLFVGDLQLPPNREGLDRFISRAWPSVRSAVPDAVFHVIGRGLTEAQQARWSQVAGVNVVGFAEDLAAYYKRCAFSVVPVFFGGGTKIKVLEALTHGRTCVASSHAMRGYDALNANGESVKVARDEIGIADACIALLNDPATRRQLATRGVEVVAREFSFAKVQRVVNDAITPLIRAQSFGARAASPC